MGTHFLTTKAPQPNRYCKYRTVNTRQSYLDPNQKQSKTHNNPSPCQRRRPPREPLRPEPKRRRRTPTRPSVVSLHTCSSPTSNARTFVMRTRESPSAKLARFSVSAGRHSTRSNEPHTRQRLLKTRSVMKMKRQVTMLGFHGTCCRWNVASGFSRLFFSLFGLGCCFRTGMGIRCTFLLP